MNRSKPEQQAILWLIEWDAECIHIAYRVFSFVWKLFISIKNAIEFIIRAVFRNSHILLLTRSLCVCCFIRIARLYVGCVFIIKCY